MRTTQLFSSLALLGLLATTAASAQWAVNGNPVCTATTVQQDIDMTANGLGGAVMVWEDNRGAAQDIYARQIERFGAVEWTPNGVALCAAAGSQIKPRVVHDGYGYLLYTWEDYRSGTADLYGAITDRLGNVLTDPDGFPICTSPDAQESAALTSDPAYGVGYVAWTDRRDGGYDIYAQAFNVSNHAFWPQDGLAFCTAAGDQGGPAVATDGADGAIVAWSDGRNGNSDIYAQRADLNGNLLWAADGVAVCTQSSGQALPLIVSDGAGGAVIAWQDSRDGVNAGAVYAQRMNASGVRQWGLNGVRIVLSSDLISNVRMISDDAGGAVFAWTDDRNWSVTGPDIYAQRIDPDGNVLWTPNGAVVCSAAFAQANLDIAPDGAGGVVATWQDLRLLGPSDIYAQHLDATGGPAWTANGVVVCGATGNQYNVQIAPTEAGASLVAWQDKRIGAIDDVFAQRIDTGSSRYGYPQPHITSVVDVPNDEGGAVRLTFRQGDGQVPGNEFEIFDLDFHGGDVVHVGTFNGSPTYTIDVLTVGVGVVNTYYVAADFSSNQASGTSYDNLAPPAPTLTGQRVGANVELQWNVTAPDIDHYVLQRSDIAPLNVTGTSYVDLSVPAAELHYRIDAVDIHGNVGPHSNQLTIGAQSGVGDTPSIPQALLLLPNSPNPFGGSTALRVGMPKAGEVLLEVYDMAGRRLAARGLGRFPEGWRDVIFDGRDDNGRRLASGVYSYRVTVGGETHARRMIISR